MLWLMALLGLGGVAAGCLYDPDANGHAVVPDGVTSIGSRAFSQCISLVSITLPNSLTKIGAQAFLGCTSLLSISLPEGITEIGEWAFKGCSSLATASLPDSLMEIGTPGNGVQPFYGTALTEGDVTLPASIREDRRHWYYYNCMGYTDITISDGLRSLGDRAFRSCDSLLSIKLPESLTIINTLAFGGCTSLVSIDLPESVTFIGRSAFEDCDSLLSIAVPRSVTIIEWNAFFSCDSLTSATLPEGLKSLGKWAFEDCTKLGLVYVPDGCAVGERAFGNTGPCQGVTGDCGEGRGFVYGPGPAAPPPAGGLGGVVDVGSDQTAAEGAAIMWTAISLGGCLLCCCLVACAWWCLCFRKRRTREERGTRSSASKGEDRTTWVLK